MTIDAPQIEILKECLTNRSSVFFHGNALDVVFETHVLEIEKDFVALKNKVPPHLISKMCESDKFGLQSKMVRFESPKIETDGVNIIFPLKQLQTIAETRSSERFPFDENERVFCQLLNPYDHETILSKAVMDMSASGFSVRSPRFSSLFQPGTLFPDIKVMIDGELYKKGAARIVYTRKLMDLNDRLRVQVGFKLEQSESPS